jgi:hypothetical protein
MWLVRRARRRYGHTHMTKWLPSSVVSGSTMLGRNVRVANRYYPALLDEIQRGDDTMHRPLPWWAPFNVLLHHWVAHDDDLLHDHPRRSLTICLRGELTEITPWGERTLRPGSLVLRGHDYIHGFRVTPEQSGRTWTIFVVGVAQGRARRPDASVREVDAPRLRAGQVCRGGGRPVARGLVLLAADGRARRGQDPDRGRGRLVVRLHVSWQPLAVVAPTNDCRKTCFEGESGLIARVPPHLVANWNRGEMVLTLTNGTMFQGYSADEPDRLRGPQHHRAWCDELAAWRYLDETLDNLLMGLRLGEAPRIVATTTPRPLKRLKEIVADPTTIVRPVSTYANLANLPKLFARRSSSGTRGRGWAGRSSTPRY